MANHPVRAADQFQIHLFKAPQIELHNILRRPIGGLCEWIWEVAARVSIDSLLPFTNHPPRPPLSLPCKKKEKKSLQTFD